MWLGLDNPAMTVYAPLYCQQTELNPSLRVGGPVEGRSPFSRESAWWAFNRVSHLAAHRWGETRHDVWAVRDPIRDQAFEIQEAMEKTALKLKWGKSFTDSVYRKSFKAGAVEIPGHTGKSGAAYGIPHAAFVEGDGVKISRA